MSGYWQGEDEDDDEDRERAVRAAGELEDHYLHGDGEYKHMEYGNSDDENNYFNYSHEEELDGYNALIFRNNRIDNFQKMMNCGFGFYKMDYETNESGNGYTCKNLTNIDNYEDIEACYKALQNILETPDFGSDKWSVQANDFFDLIPYQVEQRKELEMGPKLPS